MANQPTKKAAKKAATKVAAKKAAVTKAASAPAKASTPAPKAPASPAAVKKAPVKKAAVKKVAVAKAPVKKAAAKKAATKKAVSALTTIVAKVDVGFGNSLYLRGEGAQLSWEKGVVMGCAGDDEWVWSSDAVEDQAEFKVVLNDEIWATGPNAFVAKGERIVIEPSF